MKRRRNTCLLFIAAISLAALFAFLWQSFNSEQTTEDSKSIAQEASPYAETAPPVAANAAPPIAANAAHPIAANAAHQLEPSPLQPKTKTPHSAESPSEPEPAHRQHLIRSQRLTLDATLPKIAQAHREAGLDQFSLPTFEGESLTVAIRRVRDHPLGGTVLSGSMPGAPASRVTLAEKDGAVSGVVRWPEQNLVYEIRPLPDGGLSIGEVDLDALGQCGLCAENSMTAQHTQ